MGHYTSMWLALITAESAEAAVSNSADVDGFVEQLIRLDLI